MVSSTFSSVTSCRFSNGGPQLRFHGLSAGEEASLLCGFRIRKPKKLHRSGHMAGIRAGLFTTASAPKREEDPKKRVVITSMGLVSVFGNNVDAYYENLLKGESGITLIDYFDASKFPTRFRGQIWWLSGEGYIDPKNDRRLDDYLRYCLVAGKKALEDADLGQDKIHKIGKEQTSVLVGTRMGGLQVFSDGAQALIDKGHQPWDKDRDGFVMGEGSGVLVMESLEHAMKRGAPIIAQYLGGSIHCDAYQMKDPRADGLSVSACIERSLIDAEVSPEEVNYINTHATSTIAGDLAEVNAIKSVFKNTSEIKINTTKSIIGHYLGAFGGLEVIATI